MKTEMMTQKEHEIMVAIAYRACKDLRISSITVAMDLDYCMEYQSLDLEKLRDFPAFDFAHDIFGINANLNHETHKLENCFLPRCAN